MTSANYRVKSVYSSYQCMQVLSTQQARWVEAQASESRAHKLHYYLKTLFLHDKSISMDRISVAVIPYGYQEHNP